MYKKVTKPIDNDFVCKNIVLGPSINDKLPQTILTDSCDGKNSLFTTNCTTQLERQR